MRTYAENCIAETVAKQSVKLGLELSNCVGILTSKCSVMISETKGTLLGSYAYFMIFWDHQKF